MSPEALAVRAVDDAPAVICAVHDLDSDAIQEMLSKMDREALTSLVVVLAAAFDPDWPWLPSLDWINDEAPTAHLTTLRATQGLRPCGTHAAFIRHRNYDEEPCDDCRMAERTYQRLRKRRNRRAA